MKRLRKLGILLTAPVLALTGSVVVAPAADAAAASYYIDGRSNVNYTGNYISPGVVGPHCDSSGYTVTLSANQGLSSVGPHIWGECNYLVMYIYVQTGPHSQGYKDCGHFTVPVPNIGSACNDKVVKIHFYRDARFPTSNG
jgi:hypothetical protein